LDVLEIAIDYHEDVFQKEEVDYIFKRLMIILEQGVKDPDKPLSELTLLENDEYEELVTGLNDTDSDFPKEKTLPQLFEEQVQKHPENIALEYEGTTVTYKELNELAEKTAVKFQAAGIGPDKIVGILCERSLEAVISILGVHKAGGAYLPIDTEYPEERKNYIISNSGLRGLGVEKQRQDLEKDILSHNSEVQSIIVDYNDLKAESAPTTYKKPDLQPENLAYVIYTSGTTGNPKGTLLRHRNAVNYVSWGAKTYVKGETTFPLFTSLSFDLTVTSTFIPLLTGNKMVIYRDSKEGLLIERVVKENKVDIVKCTPSHLKIIKEIKDVDSKIQRFIVGGEELRTDTAADITDYFKHKIEIFNEYGPTETAVGCILRLYEKEADTGHAVPIGVPGDNVRIYIMDAHQRLLPKGIVGEIYIAGEGVAAGYLKRDDLTAEKFVDNPFSPGNKMYRSGDLGRWNMENIIEFFGRCDEQVKIRGYRIEPGEIEKQLHNLPGVKDAVVMVVEDKTGQKALCAYMVPEDDLKTDAPPAEWLDSRKIRRQLGDNIPDYMVPSFFVIMDNIPLTTNGKVNKRALPLHTSQVTTGPGSAPSGEEEAAIREIWAAVLGLDDIGTEDNFYEVGGDSIKAVQISSRMNDMELSVNAKDILEFQTISQLMMHVDFHKEKRTYHQGIVEGTKQPSPIEFWFLGLEYTNPHYYNLSVLLDFEKEINRDVLQKSFNTLIKQHDGLRINVDLENKTLFYNNDHLSQDVNIEVFDVPSGGDWKVAMAEVGEKVKSSLDIGKSLLIRPAIINCSGGKPKLLITAHHLIIDGVSWRILLEDLYKLYQGYLQDEEVKLPSKSASLLDWRVYLEDFSKSDEMTQEVSYWNKILDCDFTIDDREIAAGTISDRERMGFEIDEEDTETLSSGCRKSFNSDIEILLVTALGKALKETTGKKNILLEMENNGRLVDGIDLARSIGWFTAMYPKAIAVDNDDLTDLIKSVKEQLAQTPNNGMGYGVLKYVAQKLEREYAPQVRFNYLGQFDQEISNDIFGYSEVDSGGDIAKENKITVPIEINCMVIKGKLEFDFLYDGRRFSKDKVAGLMENIKEILDQLVTYFKEEDDVHFTPSDFDTVDIDADDLDALFD
ncbi:MAG: amino acid adenylation domain-containing protein, partial [bacterium]|nr:amino acid adenylation domain-containing protein [bacterium]